ncbi:hypothetical protein GCM10009540_38760 [Streptomyces turgidiscabies]
MYSTWPDRPGYERLPAAPTALSVSGPASRIPDRRTRAAFATERKYANIAMTWDVR